MWHRSTDEGSVAGAPLLLGAGVVLAVAIAVVAGLVAYGHSKGKPQASALEDVKKAYLAYSAAIVQEGAELSIAPVRPYLTDAGAAQEESRLRDILATGVRYRVTLSHDPQIVVYSGGDLASVDDILERHTTPISIGLGGSPGPDTTDTIHNSYALRKERGKWLIDSGTSFGTATAEPPLSISYAAVAVTQPDSPRPDPSIPAVFANYWSADIQAFKTLDASPLRSVEGDDLLGHDQTLLQNHRVKDQGYQIQVEHNYRIAQEDQSHAWVYDTFLDSSFAFSLTTGHPVGPTSPEIIRQSFQFLRIGPGWQLVDITQFT